MIAAATHLASTKTLFNWFDVALVLILGFGFWRGRKHGMSREFLKVTMWLSIVLAAGFGYAILGDYFVEQKIIKSVFGTQVTEKTAAYISAYLLIAFVVWIVFVFISSGLKKKLEGSNAFGSGEYYLGITSGMIRWACITVFALALLHAPVYTKAEIAAKQAYNNRWYGGGMKDFKGDFFPTLDELQEAVFDDSLLGPSIRSGVNSLLINSVTPAKQKIPVVNIGS
jgi:uncharacterized membrane protein required for colicin V production